MTSSRHFLPSAGRKTVEDREHRAVSEPRPNEELQPPLILSVTHSLGRVPPPGPPPFQTHIHATDINTHTHTESYTNQVKTLQHTKRVTQHTRAKPHTTKHRGSDMASQDSEYSPHSCVQICIQTNHQMTFTNKNRPESGSE